MTPQEIKTELLALPSQIIAKYQGNPDFVLIQSDNTDYDQGLVKLSLLGNEAHYEDGVLTALIYA